MGILAQLAVEAVTSDALLVIETAQELSVGCTEWTGLKLTGGLVHSAWCESSVIERVCWT